eukprot:c5292_g1_i1.p1 GENE.c5292_g1_i1~~c5292_g1_i1.p1  ORF type:complete len:683 (+),score=189.46 c5292_g1_i1:22-2049(+)
MTGSSGRRHADATTLVESLRSVWYAFRENMADGIQTNVRAMRQDRAFCAFLVASFTSFGASAAMDAWALKKKRKNKPLQLVDGSKPKSDGKKKPKIAATFWRDAMFLLKICIPSATGRSARLLASQFCLLVMRTLVTVRTSKICVYFLTRAITQGSWKYWVRWLISFFGWMCAGVVVNTGLKYTEAQIENEFRKQLTKHIHHKYMAHNGFYLAATQNSGDSKMPNADQRIVVDVSLFARHAAFLYGHSFTPILNFVLSLLEASKDLGYSRLVALFGINVLMDTVIKAVSPRVNQMIANQSELEAEFRRAHSRLIAHAEEVAFLHGAAAEKQILDNRLEALCDEVSKNSLKRIRKNILDQSFKFNGLLVGGLFIHAPFIMSGSMSDAERISAFRSTEDLMLRCGGSFGDMLLLSRELEEMFGYTHRIIQLFGVLKTIQTNALNHPGAALHDSLHPPDAMVSFQDVSVHCPEPDGSQRLLVKNLNMTISPGKSVLITGPNGCGKTSLFRVVAGLWQASQGSVKCSLDRMMWLPQNPYLVVGTLRDQVAYPTLLGFDESMDDQITRCLEMAGVGKLGKGPEGLARFHAEWDDVLSGGERQRLGFARLYYHKPTFAVLDEATAAINPDEELQLYRAVLGTNCTVFSIAHRHALRDLHHYELKIAGDGTGDWELTTLQHN